MTAVASKARRHQLIVDLVRERAFASQEALADELSAHGHAVTQSTLSRDLRELRILRMPQPSGYRYVRAGDEQIASSRSTTPSLGGIATVEVVGVASNEAVVILRTQIGHAQGVAVYLDGLHEPDVLATLAGDDTVLVVPTSIARVDAVERRLAEIFALPAPAGRRSNPPRRRTS